MRRGCAPRLVVILGALGGCSPSSGGSGPADLAPLHFGGSGGVRLLAVATSLDRVCVGGFFSRSLVLPGGEVLEADEDPHGFVACFDTGGDLVWSRHLGPTDGTAAVRALAFDSEDLLVGGQGSGQVQMDGSGFSLDVSRGFLLRLDRRGETIFAREIATSGSAAVFGLAPTPEALFISGWFEGEIAPGEYSEDADGFTARLDPTSGDSLWTRTFGSPGDDIAHDVVAGPSGVAVVGAVSDRQTFHSGNFIDTRSGVIEVLSEEEGSLRWRQTIETSGWGDAGALRGALLALDRGYELAITGSFGPDAKFGDGVTYRHDGDAATFLARYAWDDGATHSVAHTRGDRQVPWSLAAMPGGAVAISGVFSGELEIEDDAVVADDESADGFVILERRGAPLELLGTLRGAGESIVEIVGWGDRALWVGGSYRGAPALGDQALPAADGRDGFLAKLPMDDLLLDL